MDDRKKTDVRLAPPIAEAVEQISRTLGISKNAAHTMSVALFTAQMTPLLNGGTRTRRALLGRIERELTKMFIEAKKLA
jgi:hypothetical protein